MMKITKIGLALLCVGAGFATVPLNAQTFNNQPFTDGSEEEATVVKGYADDANTYLLIGVGQYDMHDKNIGYLAYEQYGALSQWGLADQDTGFRVHRISLKGDAYRSEGDLEWGVFTGVKVDLYWSKTRVDALNYEQSGFGIGLGAVFTPISTLNNLHVTAGGNIEPTFASFDWDRGFSFQYQNYAEIEWFYTQGNAVVCHYSKFGFGGFDERSELKTVQLCGLRYTF